MGSVTPTTQIEVLKAIKKRLLDDFGELSERSVFICDFPVPDKAVEDHLYITLAPGDGSFSDEFPGGAENQCVIENAGVVVTVFSRTNLDPQEESEIALTDDETGLLKWKRRILKSLAGKTLTNSDGNEITVNYIFPRTANRPVIPKADDEENLPVSMSLDFDTDFEWDLTT